jgi:hypothetical protein
MLKNFVHNNKAIKDSLFFNFVYIAYEFYKHLFLNGFRYYKVSQLSKLKSSDTLVILGAGSTINELSGHQFEKLGSFDVAGLSYSCFLPIKQTFYFYESPSLHQKELMREHADKILPIVVKKYQTGILKTLIWKNSESKSIAEQCDFTQFVCPNVCSVITDNPKIIVKILKICRKYSLDNYFLVQKRGSVAALLQFGMLLNYQKILFVGVDLNNTRYFFENNERFSHYELRNPYSFDKVYGGNVHRTNDPTISVPIIEVLKNVFDSEQDTQFFVSSKNSELIHYLPLWNWNAIKAEKNHERCN